MTSNTFTPSRWDAEIFGVGVWANRIENGDWMVRARFSDVNFDIVPSVYAFPGSMPLTEVERRVRNIVRVVLDHRKAIRALDEQLRRDIKKFETEDHPAFEDQALKITPLSDDDIKMAGAISTMLCTCSRCRRKRSQGSSV